MAEYTPTTDEVRLAAHNRAFFPLFRDRDEFDRWLAAHDAEVRAQTLVQARQIAEVRASVVAEEPEWEYGWRSMWANGEEYEWQALPSREAAEEAIRVHQDFEDNTDQIGGRLEFTLWKRTKSKAGPWVPVEQEGAGTDGDV